MWESTLSEPDVKSSAHNGNHMASITAAQSLYAKLLKLNEDIQLQQNLIASHKEVVLKSKSKLFYAPDRQIIPSEEDLSEAHVVHVHADKVVQHRAMLVKHYELIQQHKQMVRDQGVWVQHLTTTLFNIQQEKSAVDELMNAKMLENGCRAVDQPPQPPSPPRLPSPPHLPSTPLPSPPHLPSPTPTRSSSSPLSPAYGYIQNKELLSHTYPKPKNTPTDPLEGYTSSAVSTPPPSHLPSRSHSRSHARTRSRSTPAPSHTVNNTTPKTKTPNANTKTTSSATTSKSSSTTNLNKPKPPEKSDSKTLLPKYPSNSNIDPNTKQNNTDNADETNNEDNSTENSSTPNNSSTNNTSFIPSNHEYASKFPPSSA